jgi:hypothetical protein
MRENRVTTPPPKTPQYAEDDITPVVNTWLLTCSPRHLKLTWPPPPIVNTLVERRQRSPKASSDVGFWRVGPSNSPFSPPATRNVANDYSGSGFAIENILTSSAEQEKIFAREHYQSPIYGSASLDRKISTREDRSSTVLKIAADMESPGYGIERENANYIGRWRSPDRAQDRQAVPGDRKSSNHFEYDERPRRATAWGLEESVTIQRRHHTPGRERNLGDSMSQKKSFSELDSPRETISQRTPTAFERGIRMVVPQSGLPDHPSYQAPSTTPFRDEASRRNPFESAGIPKMSESKTQFRSYRDRGISQARPRTGLVFSNLTPIRNSSTVHSSLAEGREDSIPPSSPFEEIAGLANINAENPQPKSQYNTIHASFSTALSRDRSPRSNLTFNSNQSSTFAAAGGNSFKHKKHNSQTYAVPKENLLPGPILPLTRGQLESSEKPEMSFARETKVSQLRRKADSHKAKRSEQKERRRSRPYNKLDRKGPIENRWDIQNNSKPPSTTVMKRDNNKFVDDGARSRSGLEPKTPERPQDTHGKMAMRSMYQRTSHPVGIHDRLLKPTVASTLRSRSIKAAPDDSRRAPHIPQLTLTSTKPNLDESNRRAEFTHQTIKPTIKIVYPGHTPSPAVSRAENSPPVPRAPQPAVDTFKAILHDPWRMRGYDVFDLCRILQRHVYLDIHNIWINDIRSHVTRIFQEVRAVHELNVLEGYGNIEEIRNMIPKRMESVIKQLTKAMVVMEGKRAEAEAKKIFETIKSENPPQGGGTDSDMWSEKDGSGEKDEQCFL